MDTCEGIPMHQCQSAASDKCCKPQRCSHQAWDKWRLCGKHRLLHDLRAHGTVGRWCGKPEVFTFDLGPLHTGWDARRSKQDTVAAGLLFIKLHDSIEAIESRCPHKPFNQDLRTWGKQRITSCGSRWCWHIYGSC